MGSAVCTNSVYKAARRRLAFSSCSSFHVSLRHVRGFKYSRYRKHFDLQFHPKANFRDYLLSFNQPKAHQQRMKFTGFVNSSMNKKPFSRYSVCEFTTGVRVLSCISCDPWGLQPSVMSFDVLSDNIDSAV